MSHVMSGIAPPTDGHVDGERPVEAAERPVPGAVEAWVSGSENDFPAVGPDSSEENRPFTRMAIAIIVLFWLVQFSSLSLMRFARVPEMEGWANLQARAIVTTCAILMSIGILAVLRARRETTLIKRVLLAFGLALAGASCHACINVAVFYAIMPMTILDTPFSWAEFASSFPLLVNDFYWFYAAVSVLLLALTYGEDIVERERRIATLQAQANSAQLRALRYQLNPHFLFNTLNSVASLIAKQQGREAESMVVNLSDFLRSTLKLDPAREIPLSDEIQLQTLYLDIEKIRFPQRLKVSVDVPEGLRDALVPNLITQPLIENAIKYGVAKSSAPVHIEIIARERDGRLSLDICDDGGNADGADPKGTRVGLRNVSRRLGLHFGDAAGIEAGRRPGGGFAVRLTMPLRRA